MEIYSPTGKSYMHIAKIAKNEIKKIGIEIGNQPRETLKSFYKRQTQKPDLVTNLGMFGLNSAGLPCFSLVSNHKQYAFDGLRTEGFGITNNNELFYGEHKERDWKDFCSAYPMLIKDWKKVNITYATELSSKTKRTCVGYDNNNIYVKDVIKKYKNIDAVIVDPPRAGLSKEAIENLINLNASKIVYVSCDAVTLARDINILKDFYDLIEITPVDMFPDTYHIECVSILKLKVLK